MRRTPPNSLISLRMLEPRVLALILAGGKGSRLEVLTENRAKPATPFAGMYRLIDFALSNCMHSGISDVWIVEQYEPHSINEHLAGGRPWDLDRTYGGLQVLPPYQSGNGDEEGGFAEGNADAIFRNRALIRDFAPDLLLVLSADHAYTLDYRAVIRNHRSHEADLTLVTTRVPLATAGRFGTVRVDEDGRVTDFEYKPEEPRYDTVTTEVFVYDASKLLDTLERLAAEGEGEAPLRDFGHELLPGMVQDGRVYAFPLDGYWRDVGTPDSYFAAHQDLLASEPELRLDDPQWPILSFGIQRLPVRICGSARVENSLLSPGCFVEGTVVRSVLGPGVRVAEGATVRNSVLFAEAVVEAGATVDHAIADEGVCIGDGAAVGEPRPPGDVPAEALVLVGKGARIGAGAKVGAGARVAAGESIS